jgi:hypothetical protein
LVKGNGKFDCEAYAKNYVDWLESNPFDCGITTHNAISGVYNNPYKFYAGVE